MIHTAPLDLEQFQDKEDTADLPIELDVWSYWYDNGYPVEGIVEAHTAIHKKVDEEDTSHIVLKVETLSKPIDEADIVADKTTLLCCDCKGYQFHYSVDLEQKSITGWGSCPHIDSAYKSLKASADENQQELL